MKEMKESKRSKKSKTRYNNDKYIWNSDIYVVHINPVHNSVQDLKKIKLNYKLNMKRKIKTIEFEG